MSVKKLEHCLFLILILTSWMIRRTISDCPDQCVCMWKSGKETTECINRDKKAIPPGIAPSTQVLDLRGNNIRVLHNNVFLQLGITNLQRIYCPYCGIVEIEARAFYRLTNLVELDLSENAMREVPSEAWKHTKALMRLNLSGNPIKLIRSGAFTDLEFVTSIALSHCDIETLEDGAFEGMDALTEVKLESNKLLYLQGSGLFPRNLNHIEIHDNPFRCDCRLLDFTHWLQRSGVPRPVEPACKTPARLENRTLAGLHLEELACLPQVEPAALVTDAVAGANVSLRCSVFGLPSASVSWWHSNRLVANGSELQHAWEDQYYSIAEYRSNDHQLVSELVVLSIRPEDDGTFFCAAQNPAGVARANFTVRLVDNILDSISSGSETAVSTSSGTSGTSGLQENTDQLNLESAEIPDEDMFKVEYILGFGAAAVIVLTIIIVLILYLILQCRSQRRKRRAARAAGLHCDSNSGSYMERSTVDFIVPGEMELTSAVRSVSASAKCNGVAAKTLIQPPKDKDGCGSGNDGDDEEEYGLTSKKNSHVMYKNSWNCSNGVGGGAGGSFLPPYRHPPPYACPRSSHQQQPNNPIMCQCCGQFQPQQPHSLPPAQAWYQPQFQHPPPPHHLMMSTIPPNMAPLCPRAPNAQLGIPLRPPRPQNMLMAAQAPVPNTGSSNAYVTSHHPYFRQQQQQPPTQLHQPFFHPSGPNTNGFYHPNHHPNQFKQWILQDTSESSTACDNEEVKYGPFSDGEAEKCHYRHSSNRPTRSRSLPRRPNSSMMTYSPNVLATANVANVVPHYVTLSRSALVESADARFVEQQSLHISNQRHLPPPIAKRYSSQPHLNRNVLDYDTCNKPPIIKPKPNHVSVLPQQQPQQPQASKPPKPKYQQPVSQQELENSEYLFPDLPPPPDALLDNTTSETSIQQNSRCSSLDDLNWVTSAAEMSRVHKSPAPANTVNVIGFHQNTKKNNNTDHQRSNTLPNQAKEPISIMKKRASNPVELRRSSGAIRVDLSGADKTIRRPGSEPDLKISPMRSAMTKEKRHSGMSQTSGKKVMFSGINSDEENQENEDNPMEDNVWVLRQEDVQMEPLKIEDDIPVTGVIIAQPQPCKFAASNMQHLQTHPLVHNAHSPQKMMMQQPQGANGHAPQPPKLPKPTPPPPPPRTTPVSTGATVNQQAVAAAVAGGGAAALNAQPRPANPVLQRPMQHQQFHESPDEGYHEDDAGSEVL